MPNWLMCKDLGHVPVRVEYPDTQVFESGAWDVVGVQAGPGQIDAPSGSRVVSVVYRDTGPSGRVLRIV